MHAARNGLMPNSMKSLKRPSEAEFPGTAKAGSSQVAFEEMYCVVETGGTDAAIASTRGPRRMFPYFVAFTVMLLALGLQILSVFVDIYYVEMHPPAGVEKTFDLVCRNGCRSADHLSATPFLSSYDYYPHTSAVHDVVAQMQPFAVTCSQQNNNDYFITVSSTTSKPTIQYEINCLGKQGWQLAQMPKLIDFKYAVGFNFFHAVGARRIYRMDYSIKNQTPVVVVLIFVFSGLSIVLYAAVIRLRQKMSSVTSAHAHMRGYAENPLMFCFRRVAAAVIVFLTCSVVMALVQLIIRGTKTVPSDRCSHGCRDSITLSGTYWTIAVLNFVLKLIALALVCTCHAKRL